MEKLVASINQEMDQRVPSFNLKSKVLCRVINSHFLVCLYFIVLFDQFILHTLYSYLLVIHPKKVMNLLLGSKFKHRKVSLGVFVAGKVVGLSPSERP